MTQVSKHKLSKKTETELIGSLITVFSTITNSKEMVVFINAFLTDTEKLMLAKRLALIILILEGMPDSQISSILHVTRITVAKMRYFYEARGKEGYDIALSKINVDKRLKAFKKVLISLARYSVRAAGGYVKPGIID